MEQYSNDGFFMKKWKIVYKYKISNINYQIDEIVKILLTNRGIKTKKEIENFLNPKLENVTVESVEIDKRQLKKAIRRIQKAIEDKEQIVVFGDYDVDGICGTAILWETLNDLGAIVMPYIPHRVDEGYGLSIKGIHNVILNLFQDPVSLKSDKMLKPASRGEQVQHDNKKGLIITVDNGIVANEAVEFAKKEGIDVIITDHHVPSKKKPKAHAIIHTVNLCGAGVAYLLSQKIKDQKSIPIKSGSKIKNDKEDNHLELVALATVADLVPLQGANRTLLIYGLEKLCNTKRVGLRELFKDARLPTSTAAGNGGQAGIDSEKIGVYEIGHIIAPRLNAMGRLEYAMDSLRLLCTKKTERARKLAHLLGQTNKERQQLTLETALHASSTLRQSSGQEFKIQPFDKAQGKSSKLGSLLFIGHETYQPGVIGLVAGKLVEEYYRPSIVLSIGEKYSKASARSISGFNIIEFIRSASHLLVDAGGHPMAAGFTVETAKIDLLRKTLEEKAAKLIDQDLLTRILRIDLEIPLEIVNRELYAAIQKIAPFGMKNPEPVFISKNVGIENMRVVGKERKHISFQLSTLNPPAGGQLSTRGIAFGMGERAGEFKTGDKVDIVYTIALDTWNGNSKLQLKIKDMKIPQVSS